MEVVSRIKLLKQVVYKGQKLSIPSWAQFIAVDEDGSCAVFFRKPAQFNGCFYDSANTPISSAIVAWVDLQGEDWKESCERVVNIK